MQRFSSASILRNVNKCYVDITVSHGAMFQTDPKNFDHSVVAKS